MNASSQYRARLEASLKHLPEDQREAAIERVLLLFVEELRRKGEMDLADKFEAELRQPDDQ